MLIGLSFPCTLIFGTLAVIKFRMSDMLGSPSFKKDAICSLFGAILSFGVFFGTCIKSADEGAWWIDGVVAVLVSLTCMWVGLRTMLKNAEESNQWWTMDFWTSGEKAEEAKSPAMDLRQQDESAPNNI